ncbi:MAG TPA: hypothetical protein VHU22_12565 [Xanthobacteraceae bacterium]|jgi:hypothetical protein|nr:hypothetical protein [Xanthobacteraceae bacterium]
MLTTAKFAIAAALVFGATLSASAATKAPMFQVNQGTSSDVIPGYGKDGSRVAVPNPDR